jgi:hypothetical protein
MTEYIRDDIRKMGWWIYARDPWQQYQVTRRGFEIENGAFTFNRVLHGPPGPGVVLAGDRPQIKLAEVPSWQYGDLSLGLVEEGRSEWCHNFEQIRAIYDAGQMRYELSDPAFPGVTLWVDVLPVADAPGFIAKVTASQKTELLWAYGGLKYDHRSVDGQGPMPGGIRKNDLCHNGFELWDEGIRVTHPDLPHATCVGSRPRAVYGVGNVTPGVNPATVMESVAGVNPLAIGRCLLTEQPVYIVACLTTKAEMYWPLVRLLAFPERTWEAALAYCREIREVAVVRTPELLLNQAARGIASSLHGCWLPPSFLHGAVRWGMEAKGWWLGWRGWYGPTVLGWYERVASAAQFHAQYQYRAQESPFVGPGKMYDVVGLDGKHKLWDDGNMGEIYLDQLYHYYCWTGDAELLRQLYPTIRDVVAWERRTLDPDGDALYENHINTWISDGHWYCGGPGAQASAYMYRANLLAAEAATLAGDDPQPYRSHAAEIKEVINRELWLARKGHYAEYRELLGSQRLHDAAELPTVYHPIDSDVTDEFQTYQSLRYVETRLWRPHDLLLVNDWYPVIVTNGTIAFGEILHTALCYYRLGDTERGWRLMQGALRNFVQARVPGTISEYAGETGFQGIYVDFTDSSSIFARAAVEGLFGIRPHRQDGTLTIQPGFPREWTHASIRLRDIDYTYQRDGLHESLRVATAETSRKIVRLIAREDKVADVTVDGQPWTWHVEPGVGRAFVVIETPPSKSSEMTVNYQSAAHTLTHDPLAPQGDAFVVRASGCELTELRDPQGVLADPRLDPHGLIGRVAGDLGHHTFFIRLVHDNTTSWAPIDVEVREPVDLADATLCVPREVDGAVGYAFTLRNNRAQRQCLSLAVHVLHQIDTAHVVLEPFQETRLSFDLAGHSGLTPGVTPLDVALTGDWDHRLSDELLLWRLLDGLPQLKIPFQDRCVPVALPFNDRLEEIFSHTYASPRPPDWALQIDDHALNAWTGSWFNTDCVNMDHVRASLDKDGLFVTDVGVPFRQVSDGANGLFVSLWDRYPNQVAIPIDQAARECYLLLAGTSHNNQTYIANGRIVVRYVDGTEQVTELVNPKNYDHMFQHFSDNYPQWIGGEKEGYYVVGGASGVHADILNLPLAGTGVKEICIECLSHEIIIGLLGLTLVQ